MHIRHAGGYERNPHESSVVLSYLQFIVYQVHVDCNRKEKRKERENQGEILCLLRQVRAKPANRLYPSLDLTYIVR